MTVGGRHTASGKLVCQWFEDGELEQGRFPDDALEEVPASERAAGD